MVDVVDINADVDDIPSPYKGEQTKDSSKNSDQ